MNAPSDDPASRIYQLRVQLIRTEARASLLLIAQVETERGIRNGPRPQRNGARCVIIVTAYKRGGTPVKPVTRPWAESSDR